MATTSPSFRRGVFAGVLLLSGFDSLFYLVAAIPPTSLPAEFLHPALQLMALANILLSFALAYYLVRRDRRFSGEQPG